MRQKAFFILALVFLLAIAGSLSAEEAPSYKVGDLVWLNGELIMDFDKIPSEAGTPPSQVHPSHILYETSRTRRNVFPDQAHGFLFRNRARDNFVLYGPGWFVESSSNLYAPAGRRILALYEEAPWDPANVQVLGIITAKKSGYRRYDVMVLGLRLGQSRSEPLILLGDDISTKDWRDLVTFVKNKR